MAGPTKVGKKGRDASSRAAAGINQAIRRGKKNLHVQALSTGMCDGQSYTILMPHTCSPVKADRVFVRRPDMQRGQ